MSPTCNIVYSYFALYNCLPMQRSKKDCIGQISSFCARFFLQIPSLRTPLAIVAPWNDNVDNNVDTIPRFQFRLQRYKKKCTFANLPEEKLHDSAFFRSSFYLVFACSFACFAYMFVYVWLGTFLVSLIQKSTKPYRGQMVFFELCLFNPSCSRAIIPYGGIGAFVVKVRFILLPICKQPMSAVQPKAIA